MLDSHLSTIIHLFKFCSRFDAVWNPFAVMEIIYKGNLDSV